MHGPARKVEQSELRSSSRRNSLPPFFTPSLVSLENGKSNFTTGEKLIHGRGSFSRLGGVPVKRYRCFISAAKNSGQTSFRPRVSILPKRRLRNQENFRETRTFGAESSTLMFSLPLNTFVSFFNYILPSTSTQQLI